MRADVAVVGAGIIGALAAYELAKRGVAVALLDAEKEGAATLASAGMLAPYPEGLSGELLEAGLYGLARYPELLAELRERGLEVEAGFSGTWVAALSLGEKEAWQAQDPLPYPVRGGLGARRFPGGFVHPKALREALLEAFRNEEIRPVPAKTPAQQTLAALHRLRSAWRIAFAQRVSPLSVLPQPPPRSKPASHGRRRSC